MEKTGQPTNMPGRQEENEEIAVGYTSDNTRSSGQSYGPADQELIRQLTESRMEQKQPLEYENLDGYELPPRSQFSMFRKPAVSIKYGKLTFNMACIRLFEGVRYILPLCHPKKKRLTVIMCREEESASVEWAHIRKKDSIWVNKSISSLEYVDKLYKMMGWNRECRYKILGRVANSKEGLVLVFELDEAVMYESRPTEYVDEKTGATRERKRQVAYYPELYKDRVGKSYNDYAAARQINMFEYLEEYVGNTYSDYTGTKPETGRENCEDEKSQKSAEIIAEMPGDTRNVGRMNDDKAEAEGEMMTDRTASQFYPNPQRVLDMEIIAPIDNNDIKPHNDVWQRGGW